MVSKCGKKKKKKKKRRLKMELFKLTVHSYDGLFHLYGFMRYYEIFVDVNHYRNRLMLSVNCLKAFKF